MIAKKLPLAVLAMLVLALCLLPMTALAEDVAPAADAPQFSDMPDDWSTAALESAVANGLLTGAHGKIMPDGRLTRAEMATIVARAFGAIKAADISAFSDVKISDWYHTGMARAYGMGIIQGAHNKLDPEQPITREQVFTILARAFKLQPAETVTGSFSDLDQFSDWARGYGYALVNQGYIQGAQGKLNPQGLITRAEFAQVLYNILRQYISAPGEVTAIAAGNIMINAPGVTLKNVMVSGDLIIGDGVDNGEVVLDNVQIAGRLVVRGGGADSIIIRGNSSVGQIIVCRVDGVVSVKVEGGADVEIIYIDDGSDDVNIEGEIGSLIILAGDITVNARGADIGSLDIGGQDVRLLVDEDSTVGDINVLGSALNAQIEVEGEVGAITTAGAGTAVSGGGDVGKVEVKEGADNTSVETPRTRIEVDKGVDGVTGGGGKPVAGGSNEQNNNDGSALVKPNAGSGRDRTIAVDSVSVDPDSIAMLVGENPVQLTATVLPANASNRTVTWSSENTGIVTVSNTGLVTAVRSGITNIEARAGNQSALVRVVVGDARITTATELGDKINGAQGGEILLVSGTLGTGDEFTLYNVMKPVSIIGTGGPKPTIYGSFHVYADGVTFDNLEIHNKGGYAGSQAMKAAIDVLARQIEITNCYFVLGYDVPDKQVANGVSIWPLGSAEFSLNMRNNTFSGYNDITDKWSSCAFMITENISIDTKRFTEAVDTYGASPKTGMIDATATQLQTIAEANSYASCANDFIYQDWSKFGAHYKFVYATNDQALLGSLEYAAEGATIVAAAGIYTIGDNITVNKAVTLIGPNAGIDPNTALGQRDEEAVLMGNTASGLSYYLKIAADTTIDGLAFDNLRIDNYGAGPTDNTNLINDITIQNNIFKNVVGTAIYLRDGRNSQTQYSKDVAIRNNKIDDPVVEPDVVGTLSPHNAGSGIVVSGAEALVIAGNVITNAAYNGIQLPRVNGATVTGNTVTGCAQSALQSAEWAGGIFTISGNTFSTTSTGKAAVRLYGFTYNYQPTFNITGNTIKDSKYGIQIGHGSAGNGYDLATASYAFSGNTFTDITTDRLIVYLNVEASGNDLTTLNGLFAQVYGAGSTAETISTGDPYTYVVDE